MEKTGEDLYEGRPKEVDKQSIGQVSDVKKPTWVFPVRSTRFSSFPAGTLVSIKVKTPLAASYKVIWLFCLNCEASRNRALSLYYSTVEHLPESIWV